MHRTSEFRLMMEKRWSTKIGDSKMDAVEQVNVKTHLVFPQFLQHVPNWVQVHIPLYSGFS